MRRTRHLLIFGAICASLAPPARAEEVVELWRSPEGMFIAPGAVSVDPTDGSCWVEEGHSSEVVHLSADGKQLWRGAFTSVASLSVDPRDGSCWVANWWDGELIHLSASGSVLWWEGGFPGIRGVSANAADGSCWVNAQQLVHLSGEGKELWRGGPYCADAGLLPGVSVNPRDGSCWISTLCETGLVHLSAAGEQLWQSGSAVQGTSVSASAYDDSCWVAGASTVHLAEDGTELWRGEGCSSVSANSADGSCWVVRGGWPGGWFVCHLAPDGTELWRSPPLGWLRGLSVNTFDGSCWVTDWENGLVLHFTVADYQGLPFRDILPWHWAYHEVAVCVGANVVKGYDDDLYHPEYAVSRDQMAVYIARALVSPSGDAAIPDPEPPPSFSDVGSNHWAYKHIEYAVSQGVVKGYTDGTYLPGVTIDRGQMAVYIARAMVAPAGDAGVPDPTPPATFPDVPDTFWSYRHVEHCVDQGVVAGYTDGLYHPEYPVTRDQMAVYIARAFELL